MLPLALAAGALIVLLAAFGVLSGSKDTTDLPPIAVPPQAIPTPPGTKEAPLRDPFSYDPKRRQEFAQRAAAGNAHVLYARSPDGVVGTARRVSQWRPRVQEAAAAAGVDPDMLEALVFLESAGRPDAMTPAGVTGAAGLTQIVAGTATSLLGMHVDLAASRRLSKRIAKALQYGEERKLARLVAQRRAVDDRFDPVKALAGAGRYLKIAKAKFGSEELAFVSYHMGMGNLENVLNAYAGGPTDRPLPYAQVYFDSSPQRHYESYRLLFSFGDDSSNYLWKLYAARDIMRLGREDPAALERAQYLQTVKASAEEVLHPSDSLRVYASPVALKDAWSRGEIVPLPADPMRSGLRVDPRMGELARKLHQSKTLYRGLRPEALALALYIGAKVRSLSGDPHAMLTLTSTVRDAAYQRELVKTNFQATRNYSLHTAGWAFDVLRRYRSKRQALAFQYVLDRLTSLNLIAWVREPEAIHITASSDAAALKPLIARVR